ncbi:MAG TPA: Calx-beta domain-containing protein [Verrucomicrobiae bacterium]|nr:Calx-beta domain-containing protein [Verrucomicrobiae bacterium]
MHTAIQAWNPFLKLRRLAAVALAIGGLQSVVAQPLNDNFSSAEEVFGDWGSIAFDTTNATSEVGEPSHAGHPAQASIWFKWTAPRDGEVTLDTLGSTFDTVVAVYSGTELSTLAQTAANDDLFPISVVPQFTYSGSGDYAALAGRGSLPILTFTQNYYGPSGLRFNAKGGATYYFVVGSKTIFGVGEGTLSWAYKPSGVFRFATEDMDFSTGLPLYQTADTESFPPVGNDVNRNSVVLTYYTFNAPGVLLTVTRVGGAVGRVMVDYQTIDGTELPQLPTNNAAGIAGFDYAPVSGTLIFDDFEMSKTILIPIISSFSGSDLSNVVFGVSLSNPQYDPFESGDVAPPRIDSDRSLALVKILNTSADPYGPNTIEVVDTNTMTTNMMIVSPTNAIFNFQKANFRVPSDVNETNTDWPEVSLYISRSGTNRSATTLQYRVNNYLGDGEDGDEQRNIFFPLQPGSDYAVPTPPDWPPIRGANPDFEMARGSVSFGENDFIPKRITFTVPPNALPRFNKDFRVQLYREVQINGRNTPVLVGMVNETAVTILFNDRTPPAGSVDQLYNADFNASLALPPDIVPQTWPNNNLAHPGVAGQVYAMVVRTNDQTLAVGDFVSYNGYPQGNIALINPDGSLDLSFQTGSGANGAIFAVAMMPSGAQCVVAGDFTSFNGNGSSGIARINMDGTLDASFTPFANGAVQAMLVQPDGKIVIGGDFTEVNGIQRLHVARLNFDGTLDTDFDPGTTFNGPVYALSAPMPFVIHAGAESTGGSNEVVEVINFAPATTGILRVDYDMLGVPDSLRVYYGETNGTPIFQTGNVSGTGTIQIPFGPANGVTTNFITLVMNMGGGESGTFWSYSASVQILPSVTEGIAVGGRFDVAGRPYKNIALLNSFTGQIDPAFNPGTGPNNTVLSLAWQLNGQILAGGVFTAVNGSPNNHLVRLNQNGTVDTTNFFIGTGADDVVYTVIPRLDGTIYVGGAFSKFNGTHRRGFTRLYPNGTVDTTFLDTAYNQFAGLKRVYSWDLPAVFCAGVQTDGNVMIGGAFEQVGGGQPNTNVFNTLNDSFGYPKSFEDPNLWVEPKSRDGARNRRSIARLIGGATPGPGNIGLKLNSYTANKSQSSLFVSLLRTNGVLGPVSANFSVNPGLALTGRDLVYTSDAPLYWIGWQYLSRPTRERSDGLFGTSGFLIDPYGLNLFNSDSEINNLSTVTVSIIKNTEIAGNLNASFQLSNPSYSENFLLGGQNIPIAAALGVSTAPLALIDDTQQPGVFGFESPTFVATNANALITVLRSNGTFGTVSMRYSTANGTATVGTDYVGLTNRTLLFNQNVVSNGFVVTIRNNGFIYTNAQEKTVQISLSNLGTTPGATFGISNAIIRLINPNYQGYVTLSTNQYQGAQSAGFVNFIVNRVAGSLGSVSVRYATLNGSAVNGIDFIGTTNTLVWNSGDVAPKVISVPLLNAGVVGANRQFNLALSNFALNGTNTPALAGLTTNAIVTIINDNSYGKLQFNAPSYTVNENGGVATVTVIRTDGASGAASVSYSTSNGPNGAAGVNYVATSGVLSFSANQLAASFDIPLLNDGAVNPPGVLTFNVHLSNPVNATLGALQDALVNVIDANSFIRPPGGADTEFDIATKFNDSIHSLKLQANGQIIAVGSFTAVGPILRNRIVRLNTEGAVDADFLAGMAGANGPVLTAAIQTDQRIVLGGSFTSVNGVHRNFLARLMTDGSLDTSFNPGAGADNSVLVVAEDFIGGARKVYAGGMFSMVNSFLSPRLIRLNNDGSADPSFSVGTGADGIVKALAVYPTNSIHAGKLIVGGSFTHFNGVPVPRLARLNADGSLDTVFVANLASGPGADVDAIVIQPDGGILVGGSFTNFHSTLVNRLVLLTSNGNLDSAFLANLGSGFNDTVNAIALQSDNRIVVGGQFTQGNGVTRNHVTRLLANGSVDPTINFGAGANGDVEAVLVQPDGMIVIGGAFTEYDEQPHENIARVYGGSTTGSGAFSFTSANYEVTEFGSFAVVTVRRTGGTSGPNPDGSGNISILFRTANGTAVSGINYLGTTNTLIFPPGEVLKIVTIPIMDDFVVTSNLTVNLSLSNPTPPAGIGNQSTAVLTIVNTDTSVSLSSSIYSVLKNVVTGGADISIVRQGGSAGTASVAFATTTGGTAVAGVDYIPTNTIVTFLPGETVKSVRVPVIDNGLPQGNKTVAIALSNPSGSFLQEPSTAILTIVDTVIAPGTISFASPTYSASEGDSSVLVTAIRTGGTSGNVSVSYTTVASNGVSGVNYVHSSGLLSFNDGQSSRSFTVPLVDNSAVQGTVRFSIVLSAPTGGASLGVPSTTVVSVADNDEALSIAASGAALISESTPNGWIDTNETVTLAFGLRVASGTNIGNLTATLLATNGIVSPSPASNSYGALSVRGPSASRNFSFTVNPTFTNGQQIVAVLQVRENGNPIGFVQFPFVLGSFTRVFSNATPIAINDNTSASPYPSTITVSGLGRILTKATVSLNRVSHSFPRDIQALVASPAAPSVMVQGNAGGSFTINNVNLTFDDLAAAYLTTNQITAGTYRPTVMGTVTSLPNPAPSAPYSTNLSTFNGANPNGVWSLFVKDNAPFNTGSIAGGWSLSLTTVDPLAGAADVGVSVSAAGTNIPVGAQLVYVIAVTNYGPSIASDVVVTNLLPAGLSFVSTTPTAGSFVQSAGTIRWNVGTLAVNAGGRMTVTVNATTVGAKVSTILSRTATADPNAADDVAFLVANVTTATPPTVTGVRSGFGIQLSVGGAAVPTVVQASTNLTQWLPIFTNVPPFIFTDPNVGTQPYRFYRAVAQ